MANSKQKLIASYSELFLASEQGDINKVRELLVYPEIKVRIRTKSGATLLHNAAWSGNKELVHLLVQHGAVVNAVTTMNMTPLHIAVWNGNNDVVTLLMQKGAAPHAKDNLGRSPFSIAMDRGYLRTASLLFSHENEMLYPFVVKKLLPFIQNPDSPNDLPSLTPKDQHFLYTQRFNIRCILEHNPQYSKIEGTGFRTTEERKAKNLALFDQTIALYETPVSMLDNALYTVLMDKRQIFIDGILEKKGIDTLVYIKTEDKKEPQESTKFLKISELYEQLKALLLPNIFNDKEGKEIEAAGPRADKICIKTLSAFQDFVEAVESAEKSRSSESLSDTETTPKSTKQYINTAEPFLRISNILDILDIQEMEAAKRDFELRDPRKDSIALKALAPQGNKSFAELIAAQAEARTQRKSSAYIDD